MKDRSKRRRMAANQVKSSASLKKLTKVDPTRTQTVRRAFSSKLELAFAQLRGRILREFIVEGGQFRTEFMAPSSLMPTLPMPPANNSNPNHDELGRFASGDSVKYEGKTHEVHMVNKKGMIILKKASGAFFQVHPSEVEPITPAKSVKQSVPAKGETLIGLKVYDHVENPPKFTKTKLTKDQAHAIAVHTGGASEDPAVRDELKSLKTGKSVEDLSGRSRQVAETLRSAMVDFKQPIDTYRGMGKPYGMSADHADVKLYKAFIKNLDGALASNGTLTMNGFTSTSISPSIASGFAGTGDDGVIFHVKQRRGVWAADAPKNDYKGQREIIADHGAEYRVIGKSRGVFDSDIGHIARTVYHLEEL